jgi:hypothetical protein
MNNFNFNNFNSGEFFKQPKPISLSGSNPSPDDLTSLFTDAKDFALDVFKNLADGAKATDLGASFMENASQIIGLAVLLLGIALYIQIKAVNENITKDKNENQISEMGDKEKTVSKQITLELFTPVAGSVDDAAKAANTNPHDPPKLANRDGSAIKNAINGKINFENIISDSISTMVPSGPSDAKRESLRNTAQTCNSTSEFCKANHADIQKACGDITTQSSCAQKCCCGWVKFSIDNTPDASNKKGTASSAQSSALNGFGISPDGKCVAGNADGPELSFNRDIDYYYYMGECMKGVCKSKGS